MRVYIAIFGGNSCRRVKRSINILHRKFQATELPYLY